MMLLRKMLRSQIVSNRSKCMGISDDLSDHGFLGADVGQKLCWPGDTIHVSPVDQTVAPSFRQRSCEAGRQGGQMDQRESDAGAAGS